MKTAKLAVITVRDIQNTKTNLDQDLVANRIRKSWVLQMPASEAAKMKAIARDARFMLYKDIDRQVQTKWIELMRKHHEESIQNGAKLIGGTRILEKSYQIDTDELLIEAASIVITDMISK